MFFQVALEYKRLAAQLALEGAVVGVHAEVLKDVLLLGEFLVAALKLALEGGGVSVGLVVEDSPVIVPISRDALESFQLSLGLRVVCLCG